MLCVCGRVRNSALGLEKGSLLQRNSARGREKGSLLQYKCACTTIYIRLSSCVSVFLSWIISIILTVRVSVSQIPVVDVLICKSS